MSIRRDILDELLKEAETSFLHGTVLDIGGKKNNKRGAWRPSPQSELTWLYLNLDSETLPDHLRPADNTGLEKSSIDSFTMCELLEHVENPRAVLIEARRILRPDGVGFITMPFLNQVHADPNDFQRWTPTKLRAVLESSGFRVEKLTPMGSVFAVIFDLLLASISRWQANSPRPILARGSRVALNGLKPLFQAVDRKAARLGDWITTGWCVKVRAE